MEEEIRVRFAPSPTGKFHIGSARTALFNFLFAKKRGGKFILRIENTDKKRSTEEFEQDIYNSLTWLGLHWDEGPMVDGKYGPYKQSERLNLYREHIDKLLKDGSAYYCYCTLEELKKEREEQEKKHQAPKYSGRCRNLTAEQIEKFKKEGRRPSVKFKVPDEKVAFKDLVKGDIEFDMKLFGDFTIVTSDDQPLFLLTNAIDDALMKTSHVIRGEDHISNTPKQILLYQALDYLPPEFAHLSMILNPDKTKLSKRKNPTSLTDDFKERGFLPEAMVNFIAFLGWNPGTEKEIFLLEELETEFSLDKVGKSPAIFNIERLEYLNGYYIRQMKLGDLADACFAFLERDNPEGAKIARENSIYYLQVVSLLQERLKRLEEIAPFSRFFFADELEYEAELLIPKKSDKETTLRALKLALQELEKAEPFSRDNLEKSLRGVATELGISAGDVLWPVRAAITGEKASPGVFEVLDVLEKERSVRRVSDAILKLEQAKK